MCCNYELSLTMSWVGCLLTDLVLPVKRMGITEILRRIWLFSANKTKSFESFSKQPTQLIVKLNSSLRHIIVTMVSNSCSVHVNNNTWLMTQFNDHLLQIETCKNFNDMLLHLAKYFMNGDIFCKTKNWEFKEFNRLVKVQFFWEGHKYLPQSSSIMVWTFT